MHERPDTCLRRDVQTLAARAWLFLCCSHLQFLAHKLRVPVDRPKSHWEGEMADPMSNLIRSAQLPCCWFCA